MLNKVAQQFSWKAVEALHGLHHDWTAYRIAKELKEGDNQELANASLNSLCKIASRCLKRITDTGCVKRRSGQGRPRSARTEEKSEQVINFLKDRRGRSSRLAAEHAGVSQRSVLRIATQGDLKPYHVRKTSRIRPQHLLDRIRFARYMLRHFGSNPLRPNGSRLTRLVNTDFSKHFRLTPTPNTKNQVIWSQTRVEADEAGGVVGIEKFSPGTMLFGGVSWRGLIPTNAPIFVDDFLQDNFDFERGEKKTVNGDRYSVLLRQFQPEVLRLYPNRDAIWQDDGATIHRTADVLRNVDHLFLERVPAAVQCAKFDDCWPIENLWGIIKERIGLQEFTSLVQLKARITEIWQGVSRRTCRKFISSIPKRCRVVIRKQGQRLSRNDYRNEN